MAVIEYVYSAHSAFAYLGSAKLSQICRDHKVVLVHRPIFLTPVVEAQGAQPFAGRTQAHVDYFFGREIERWAEARGVEILDRRPTHHDADYALASGMILALGDEGVQTEHMAHALLQAHWRDDADLSDATTLGAIAASLGHNPEGLLARAASGEVQAKLAANTDWARDLPVFGSPTYIVNGDPFYGQDRLEMVERSLRKPFHPTNWCNPPVGAM